VRLRTTRALATLVAGSLLAIAAPAGAAPARSWADGSIRVVIAAGVLPDATFATYHPAHPLDHGTLAMLVWGAVPGAIANGVVPADADPATIGDLDAAFVRGLGLGDVAAAAQDGLVAAGYHPRADAGTEIVARLLGLRYNHPAAADRLERSDTEIATRAEAAFTTAVVLRGVDLEWARAAVAKIAALPLTTGKRHAAIDTAVQLIGRPYVWGGTWDEAAGGPNGAQLHGGYDCSGLLWRTLVFDAAGAIATPLRIGGRTTFEMARTTPVPRRLGRTAVRPGDILLFAPAGRRAHANEVGHAGLDIGNGLMIHSSSQGVALTLWDTGWHRTSFAWGKAVLPG
jgi:cell wall-associated NlpC family hydrolase